MAYSLEVLASSPPKSGPSPSPSFVTIIVVMGVGEYVICVAYANNIFSYVPGCVAHCCRLQTASESRDDSDSGIQDGLERSVAHPRNYCLWTTQTYVFLLTHTWRQLSLVMTPFTQHVFDDILRRGQHSSEGKVPFFCSHWCPVCHSSSVYQHFHYATGPLRARPMASGVEMPRTGIYI